MNDTPGTPRQLERDEAGRLIYLAIDSTPPLPAEDNPWLVAVDGSPQSLRATAEAARMASCALHLVNVQHWLAVEAAEAELPLRGWNATAEARALLDAAGRPWRLHVTMGEAADSIAALAKRLGCNGIVIGSHGMGAATALLLGSVSQRVMHLATTAVRVVR